MDRRELAVGVATFVVVFLLVVGVEAVLLNTSLSIALPVAAIVGAGVGLYAWYRTTRSSTDR